jgi:sugar/nucleoside kinase (ribokinase family)
VPSPHVLVAGPVSWNRIVRLDALPEPRPHTVFARGHVDTVGGTSAGKALNLASLGAAVTLSTVVGDDREADLVRAGLDRDGLTLLAETAPGGTEQHLNLMDDRGGRLSVYLRLPEAPTATVHDAALDAALAACDVAVVDLAEWSRPLLDRARAVGRPVWCDVHDHDGLTAFHRPWVEAADVLFLNDDAMDDPLPFMRSRVAAGTSLVICTQGAAGATAVTADEELRVPAAPVLDVVDTNGAGDAFASGFLLAHLAGRDLGAAVEAGHRQAAACLRSPGLAPQP